jgi:hypothetical protein
MREPASPGDLMPNEIDEDLIRLEADIRQLKIQYEQYFGGGRKRPPTDMEWRIDQTMKRYGDRGAEMNYTQRFRFSNLAQTYSKYREFFHKRLQKHEGGIAQRHFGAAARAIEAERARARGAEASDHVFATATDTGAEPQDVEQLYNAFREALERSGQPTDKLSRESFERFLQQKTEQLQAQGSGREVEFFVSAEEGGPRLKARVKS